MARGAVAIGGRVAALALALCITCEAWAQTPIIYPSKGQTPD
jgi:hypothetical protein